ncbi:stringent starvation protein B [Thiomicrorhabdus immobilis]|uniref:Stringent starvation protein B n=1 Tax=Thiomicrorhabdus immobilis TaxID=2791037 RepID=A0ABM7MEN9_9GAMM|nr:ClpXP protease specificity-enhancing factor [Thiomicrorhabdus immobilis]BCN93912.1 stringent starvation protein B [Thiomicrorhabdus immobilis]
MEMISNRPYLIRAIYDWIVDNQWTPHFQIDANYPGTNVPHEYVQEGVIVLNAHPSAVFGLSFDNDLFSFKARFQGVERSIFFPPEAVLAVFARENGQGMPFPAEPYPENSDALAEDKPNLQTVDSEDSDKKPNKKAQSSKKKPTLSIVK